jgi:hypothetical protein
MDLDKHAKIAGKSERRDHLEDLDINGRIILILIFRN